MRKFYIMIALKGGNYIKFACVESELKSTTQSIFNFMKDEAAGNKSRLFHITELPDGGGFVGVAIGNGQIAGFAIEEIKPDDPVGFNKDFMIEQLEIMKLQKKIFTKQIQKMDEGEDWKV